MLTAAVPALGIDQTGLRAVQPSAKILSRFIGLVDADNTSSRILRQPNQHRPDRKMSHSRVDATQPLYSCGEIEPDPGRAVQTFSSPPDMTKEPTQNDGTEIE